MSIFGQKKQSEWVQATQSKEGSDWTAFLSPDATILLRSVLEAAYKHRQAYFKADDIKNAQLWSAILEIKREIDEINKRLDKMSPQEKETFRFSLSDGGEAMEKIKSALRPGLEDTREAKDALIESLMKF
jgi:hypothetical protein